MTKEATIIYESTKRACGKEGVKMVAGLIVMIGGAVYACTQAVVGGKLAERLEWYDTFLGDKK